MSNGVEEKMGEGVEAVENVPDTISVASGSVPLGENTSHQTPSKKRPREVEALTDSSRTKRVRKANTRYKDEDNEDSNSVDSQMGGPGEAQPLTVTFTNTSVAASQSKTGGKLRKGYAMETVAVVPEVKKEDRIISNLPPKRARKSISYAEIASPKIATAQSPSTPTAKSLGGSGKRSRNSSWKGGLDGDGDDLEIEELTDAYDSSASSPVNKKKGGRSSSKKKVDSNVAEATPRGRSKGNSNRRTSTKGRSTGTTQVIEFATDSPLPEVLDELEWPKDECNELLDRLRAREDAVWFLQPVDPVMEGIPTYFDIITEPMDLGTISKLIADNVYGNADEFAEDVRLVWRNACTFNHPDSLIYNTAKRLEKYFNRHFKIIQQKFKNTRLASTKSTGRSRTSSSTTSLPKLSLKFSTSSTTPSSSRVSSKTKESTTSDNAYVEQLEKDLEAARKKIARLQEDLKRARKTIAEQSKLALAAANTPTPSSRKRSASTKGGGRSRSRSSSTKNASVAKSTSSDAARPKRDIKQPVFQNDFYGSPSPSPAGNSRTASPAPKQNRNGNASSSNTNEVEMTRDEKRELSDKINDLHAQHLAEVVTIIHESISILPEGGNAPDVVEIDMDTLDNSTLRKLEKFVADCLAQQEAENPGGEGEKQEDDAAMDTDGDHSDYDTDSIASDAEVNFSTESTVKVDPPASSASALATATAHSTTAPTTANGGDTSVVNSSSSDTVMGEAEDTTKPQNATATSLTNSSDFDTVKKKSSSLSFLQSLPSLSSSSSGVKTLSASMKVETEPEGNNNDSVVLKNEESWNMLKDDSLNSSSEQKNSDLQANTREKNESNLWSEFKQKELQLKQKEKEIQLQKEREEQARLELLEKKKKEEEERIRAREQREQEQLQAIKEAEEAKVQEREQQRLKAKMEREKKANSVSLVDEQRLLMYEFESGGGI